MPEAIDSALAQTYPIVKVIVVNDGFPDHTREVAIVRGIGLLMWNRRTTVLLRHGITLSGCCLLHRRRLELQLADLDGGLR